MSNVREIKAHIISIGNIKQITRAMKMVAAARIKKAERLRKSCENFFLQLKGDMGEILGFTDELIHPFLTVRPVTKVGLIVVTSDKGLCGAFNHNVLKHSLTFMNSFDKDISIKLIMIGQKTENFYKKFDCEKIQSFTKWNSDFNFAEKVTDLIVNQFEAKELDQVYFVYGKPINAMIQKPSSQKVLPLTLDDLVKNKIGSNYIFEPEVNAYLSEILPLYVKMQVYYILLESRAAELAAKLKAMTSATENAEDIQKELQVEYFKRRQDEITTQLIEIASGAQALNQ